MPELERSLESQEMDQEQRRETSKAIMRVLSSLGPAIFHACISTVRSLPVTWLHRMVVE